MSNINENCNEHGNSLSEIIERTLQMLDEHGVKYTLVCHEAISTVDGMHQANLPHPERIAKNLFLRDDKHKSYYLFTLNKDRSISLKELRRIINSRPLSFASEAELKSMLNLLPGSVTPLGLINNAARDVRLYIDEDLYNGIIGVHPCENTATVYLSGCELLELLTKFGCQAQVLKLS